MKTIIVKITALDDDGVDIYGDVHPQLILEDALHVAERGWPQGFEFEIIELPTHSADAAKEST